mmetsp:Transcript_14024/g.34731  ORF Transcript_14024/g.34731 Transcript_14024/m.34731 type:complete len:467 (-) Transcript_14024:528-1928(-)
MVVSRRFSRWHDAHAVIHRPAPGVQAAAQHGRVIVVLQKLRHPLLQRFARPAEIRHGLAQRAHFREQPRPVLAAPELLAVPRPRLSPPHPEDPVLLQVLVVLHAVVRLPRTQVQAPASHRGRFVPLLLLNRRRQYLALVACLMKVRGIAAPRLQHRAGHGLHVGLDRLIRRPGSRGCSGRGGAAPHGLHVRPTVLAPRSQLRGIARRAVYTLRHHFHARRAGRQRLPIFAGGQKLAPLADFGRVARALEQKVRSFELALLHFALVLRLELLRRQPQVRSLVERKFQLLRQPKLPPVLRAAEGKQKVGIEGRHLPQPIRGARGVDSRDYRLLPRAVLLVQGGNHHVQVRGLQLPRDRGRHGVLAYLLHARHRYGGRGSLPREDRAVLSEQRVPDARPQLPPLRHFLRDLQVDLLPVVELPRLPLLRHKVRLLAVVPLLHVGRIHQAPRVRLHVAALHDQSVDVLHLR